MPPGCSKRRATKGIRKNRFIPSRAVLCNTSLIIANVRGNTLVRMDRPGGLSYGEFRLGVVGDSRESDFGVVAEAAEPVFVDRPGEPMRAGVDGLQGVEVEGR